MADQDLNATIDRIFNKEDLTERDNQTFLSSSPHDIAKNMSERFGIDFKQYGMAVMPQILTEFYRKFPTAFKKLIEADVFFLDIKGDSENEIESENIRVKEEFNYKLNEIIVGDGKKKKGCHRMCEITNDYDLLGTAENIKNEELRARHRAIGKANLTAFRKAKENNGAVIEMCMRVFDEPDQRPWAVNSARQLLESGVDVYNYDKGEKFGVIYTADLVEGWRINYDKMLERIDNKKDDAVRKLSEETEIPMVKLKKFSSNGLEPTSVEAMILENYSKRISENSPECAECAHIVVPSKITLSIYREFLKDWSGTHAELPQPHRRRYCIITKNWDQLANTYNEHFNKEKKDPITLDMLKNY